MIEFKTKYSTGPFEVHHEDGDWYILNGNGRIIAETHGVEDDDENEANRHVLGTADKMAKYMMGRAKELHEEINMYYCSPSSWIDEDIKKDTINELEVILSTLKYAGIEVVEK